MAASLAASPSFPRRSHPAPFVRSVPLASPRRGAARRTLPAPAHAGGDGGGEGGAGRILDPLATPFQVLGLDASAGYSAAQLKAAFRARVKEFHPDVCKDTENADLIMRRVLEAYEMLSDNMGMMLQRNNIDPFDEPECEARDIFVNELLCIGTGPSLRMPVAGNTAACLHPRRVPGPGKPGRRFVNFVFIRLCMPGAGNTGACLRPRCVPGLGKPAAKHRQQHLPGAPLLRHHCAHANSAPPCACGSTATSSTPATPTRHRPRHSSHGYLDHGFTTHTLGYLDNDTKGYRLA